jgi:hypothetical protein
LGGDAKEFDGAGGGVGKVDGRSGGSAGFVDKFPERLPDDLEPKLFGVRQVGQRRVMIELADDFCGSGYHIAAVGDEQPRKSVVFAHDLLAQQLKARHHLASSWLATRSFAEVKLKPDRSIHELINLAIEFFAPVAARREPLAKLSAKHGFGIFGLHRLILHWSSPTPIRGALSVIVSRIYVTNVSR